LEEWAEGTVVAFVLLIVILVELFLKGTLTLKGAIFAVIGDGFLALQPRKLALPMDVRVVSFS